MHDDFECTVSLPKGRGMVKTTRGTFRDAQTLATKEGFDEQSDRWWDRVRDILKSSDHQTYIREQLEKFESRPDNSLPAQSDIEVGRAITDNFFGTDKNDYIKEPEVQVVQASSYEQEKDASSDIDLGDPGIPSDS